MLNKHVLFSLRLDEEAAVTFKALAALNRTTPTVLLRRCVNKYIESNAAKINIGAEGVQMLDIDEL